MSYGVYGLWICKTPAVRREWGLPVGLYSGLGFVFCEGIYW